MNSFADAWFSNQGWTAHGFQKKSWAAMAKGRSGLLNAPTGYGKTMAIWFGVLHHYYIQRKLKRAKMPESFIAFGSRPYAPSPARSTKPPIWSVRIWLWNMR